MPEDRRIKPLSYGEAKKPRQFTTTETASAQLDELCDRLKITRSELVEQLIRAAYATKELTLIQAFLDRAKESGDE